MKNVETQQFLFAGIFLLANKLQVAGDRIIDQITLKQWFLLVMMTHMETHAPSITEIAEFIGGSRQNVRKMVATLEEKGFVETAIHPHDRRNLTVSLTLRAQHFFEGFQAKGMCFLDTIFEDISQESLKGAEETFEALLEKLSKIEEAHHEKNRSAL